MLIVIEDVSHGLVVRNATAVERLHARLRAGALDRRLAEGRRPETHPLLALRAGLLVRPRVRWTLAVTLRDIVCEASSPRRRRQGLVTAMARRYICDAADVLVALADRLESPCPVSALGVAKAKLLLTDGAGPLYHPASGGQLRDAAHEAVSAMDAPMI